MPDLDTIATAALVEVAKGDAESLTPEAQRLVEGEAHVAWAAVKKALDEAGLAVIDVRSDEAEATYCTCGADGSGEEHEDWCIWAILLAAGRVDRDKG